MITIKIPFDVVIPLHPATGLPNRRYNASLDALYTTAIKGGARPQLQAGIATLTIADGNADLVTVKTVLSIVRAGGEVLGKLAFLVTDDVQQPCPEAFPDRTAIDNTSGNAVPMPIYDWVKLKHRRADGPEQVGSSYYVSCSDGQNYFPGTTLAELDSENWKLVDAADLIVAREKERNKEA